jgi:hypothetical protein
VILTILQNTRMRTVTNMFLLNLAISDLLLGVFCMPFTLIGQLLRDFIFGDVFCRLISFFQGKTNLSYPYFWGFLLPNVLALIGGSKPRPYQVVVSLDASTRLK